MYDPPEPQLIGRAFYPLEQLANLFDLDANVIIVGPTGAAGNLKMNITPHLEDEEENPEADLPESV